MAANQEKQSFIDRALAHVERVGNALPNTSTLFGLLALLVVFLSWVFSAMGTSAVHPVTDDVITPVNLLSGEGLRLMVTELVNNFTSFAPLGTVLVAMLGLGIAEETGLISSALRKLVMAAPQRLLTFVIVLAGVLSNIAVDAGYVLLIPLGGIIFLAVGRHPLAGLAAAFAGVSGGFSANLVVGPLDALLGGISQEAAHIFDPNYTVNIAGNFYFILISTLLVAVVGTWVTEKIVIPRLGSYTGEEKAEELRDVTDEERRGLRWAGWALVGFVVLLLFTLFPENGMLRNQETGDILNSPFMSGIVALIFVAAAIAGIAYGLGAKTITSDDDVIKGMDKTMNTLGSYMVLVFFAAQFVAYFNWTNLGVISAIKGAEVLQASGLGPIPLLIAFILFSALINIVIGSASAKWALMAPIFVPMFMILDYSPELVQAAYRVGDSVTNIISPMMLYFALVLAFFQRYDQKAGLGTVIATMLPYSVAFLISWSILFAIMLALGIPVGPGTPLFLD